MAKKSFKDNPALSFISQESIDRAERTISTSEAEPLEPQKAPEGYKLNHLYIETKSKRLQLLIQPTLYTKLKSKAQAESISVNALINRILQEALKEE